MVGPAWVSLPMVWAKMSLKKNDAITKSDSAKQTLENRRIRQSIISFQGGYGNYQLPAGRGSHH